MKNNNLYIIEPSIRIICPIWEIINIQCCLQTELAGQTALNVDLMKGLYVLLMLWYAMFRDYGLIRFPLPLLDSLWLFDNLICPYSSYTLNVNLYTLWIYHKTIPYMTIVCNRFKMLSLYHIQLLTTLLSSYLIIKV